MTDPIKQFEDERRMRVQGYEGDKLLRDLSLKWLEQTMQRGYTYNFSWMGRPIIQYPSDMAGLQELVWDIKPDLIIETGIAHGGSLILSASLLALLDLKDGKYENKNRKVLGVDIDIRAHNRTQIEAHPLSYMIEMIQGSSVEQSTIDQVKAVAAKHKTILVCLDSMHTHDHVLKELEAYAPLASVGSYCIVYDSFVEDMPPGFFKDRPWDQGNNPKTAIFEWLKGRSDFVIDKSVQNKLQVTSAPDGFLKRVR
jgi:cephalosporin hydroxylase